LLIWLSELFPLPWWNRKTICAGVTRTLTEVNVGKTTLYRPVGPKESALITASHQREFLPRLPEQPLFYPIPEQEAPR
jgi:hypothetical protein